MLILFLSSIFYTLIVRYLHYNISVIIHQAFRDDTTKWLGNGRQSSATRARTHLLNRHHHQPASKAFAALLLLAHQGAAEVRQAINKLIAEVSDVAKISIQLLRLAIKFHN